MENENLNILLNASNKLDQAKAPKENRSIYYNGEVVETNFMGRVKKPKDITTKG